MKRLLCVLMVMVMAVLVVPAIAQEVDQEQEQLLQIVTVDPIDAERAGCITNCTTATRIYDTGEGGYIWDWHVWIGKNPSGYRFTGWMITIGNEAFGPFYRSTDLNMKLFTRDESTTIIATACFEKEAPAEPDPEPEPIVVVEEKKPEEPQFEEPHVHSEKWVSGTPPTCTSTGLTDGLMCEWCGAVLKAQTEIPKIDHVYSMWVPNGSGKHFASCLYCGNKIDAACEKVQLPIKSTSGAAVILCPVCGDCSGATATAVKGLKVGEGAPYRGTLRVWNIDAGDGNKYLAVSFDRFGKIMQPEGEVSVTLPDDLKGTTAGVISADGNVKTVQESNGTLKLDFTGSQVVVLKGN